MLEDLPPGWNARPLESCMAAIIDYRGKTPRKTTEGIPLVTAKVVKGGRIETPTEFIDPSEYDTWMRRGLPKAGDVLLTTEAPLGEVAQLDHRRVALAQRLICLRGQPGILDNTFLRFALQSETVQRQLRARATGTTVLGIRQSELRQVLLPSPPFNEQRAIASVLGALDDKIELNRRMNETLEELARTIFKSWFVNFDPVRAKAEGRRPARMDDETAALFPNRIVQSELGEVPEGWRPAPLSEWATTLSGGTPSKSDASLWGGALPWISPKVMTAIHADETDAFVTAAAIGNGTRLAPAGSTLVMVRGMGLHKEVRVSQARRDLTFNQDVKALVPKGIEPTLLLLGLLDSQPTLLGRVQSSGHGTGVLPSDILLSHRLFLPSPDVQKKLAAPLDAMNSRVEASRSESRTLAELRDLLLPKLISGELRVPTAEKMVEAAL